MLILTRRLGESILIKHGDTDINITVHKISAGRIKLGIEAPDMLIRRAETVSLESDKQLDPEKQSE